MPQGWGNETAKEQIHRIRARTLVNCWHAETRESDAMWRIYGQKEEMVAVRSDVARLRQVVDVPPQRIGITKVRYIPLDTYQLAEHEVYYPFANKDSCFEHEQEIRAFVHPDLTPQRLVDHVSTVPPRAGMSIPADPSSLITGIVVSPYGSEWFLKSIRGLVKELGFAVPVDPSSLFR